jgi:lysophospholipase
MASEHAQSSAAVEDGSLAAADGTRLVYSMHRCSTPRATVLVAHGYAEHRRRYRHVVDVLLPAGISVLTYDLRGHGESGGRRGFVHAFDEYLDDLGLMVEFAREQMAAPLFVLGHSMGGLIATRWLQNDERALAGVVLSNPALQVKMPVPGWKMTLARMLSRMLPAFSLPTGLPAEFISRDPEEVRLYAEDPLVFPGATTRWAVEFSDAQEDTLRRPADFRAAPTLVLLGSGDRVIDSTVSQSFYADVASTDCQVRVRDGAYHELFNDQKPDRDEVLAEMVAWLDEKIAAAA